ncbi:MAG TPA: protease pro-enzyme activation domain-containing protein, partial [bacterium]|nr:protease pro-enzyme activation domain-containing protein [bacterium]
MVPHLRWSSRDGSASYSRKKNFITSSFSFLFLTCFVLMGWSGPVQAAGRQQLSGHVPIEAAQAPLIGDMPDSVKMNLAIGLPLRNPSELQDLLKKIYDPHSAQYHHFITPDEFTNRFGPTAQDYQSVLDFAKANHLQVTHTYPNRLLVDIAGTASDVKKTFHVNLRYYQRPDGTQFHAPDVEPSLDLDTPVEHIAGLDNFKVARTNHTKKIGAGKSFKRSAAGIKASGKTNQTNAGSGVSGWYQGQDFRDAYCSGVPASLNGSGQSVGLFEADGFFDSDIAYYESS